MSLDPRQHGYLDGQELIGWVPADTATPGRDPLRRRRSVSIYVAEVFTAL